jgi:hypothetical protein
MGHTKFLMGVGRLVQLPSPPGLSLFNLYPLSPNRSASLPPVPACCLYYLRKPFVSHAVCLVALWLHLKLATTG